MQHLYALLGGAFTRAPDDLLDPERGLSAASRTLVERAFEDIDGELVDYHTHVLGTGCGGTGCCVAESLTQPWRHPLDALKFRVMMSASGVKDAQRADQQYMERLSELVQALHAQFPGKWGHHHLLGMTHWRDPKTGALDARNTGIYTPNDYVHRLAGERPALFWAAPSIHPLDPRAVEQLEHAKRDAVAAGQRQLIIKWLPNAQGINPASPRCDAFYEACARLGAVLLVHVGRENAVSTPGLVQSFGNPLRLRRALDAGVRVVAAHCASEGTDADLDLDVTWHMEPPLVSSFSLLLRLFDDARYTRLLYADISSMTLFRRIGVPLTTMLERTDLHRRLVNGSDYPVVAAAALVQTQALVRHGYITREERAALNEVYDYNVLLYDYVVKRCLRSPTGARFAPSVFTECRALDFA